MHKYKLVTFKSGLTELSDFLKAQSIEEGFRMEKRQKLDCTHSG